MSSARAGTTGSSAASTPVDTTLALVERAQAGDLTARDALFARCLPALRRWAQGRLPVYARDIVDTADLVQDAAISTLKNLDAFRPRHPGALNAYLREAIANRIHDHIRRAKRRPVVVSLEDSHPNETASPLDLAIGREQVERYEAALARLTDLDRAAIVSRIEMQQSYEGVAEALGKPNANAARSTVLRAIERLVREIDREA